MSATKALCLLAVTLYISTSGFGLEDDSWLDCEADGNLDESCQVGKNYSMTKSRLINE